VLTDEGEFACRLIEKRNGSDQKLQCKQGKETDQQHEQCGVGERMFAERKKSCSVQRGRRRQLSKVLVNKLNMEMESDPSKIEKAPASLEARTETMSKNREARKNNDVGREQRYIPKDLRIEKSNLFLGLRLCVSGESRKRKGGKRLELDRFLLQKNRGENKVALGEMKGRTPS